MAVWNEKNMIKREKKAMNSLNSGDNNHYILIK